MSKCRLAVHIKMSTLVLRVLGAFNWVDKTSHQTLGRTFISLQQLQTIVLEIKSMLNNRPLNYVNSDLQVSQALSPPTYSMAGAYTSSPQ